MANICNFNLTVRGKCDVLKNFLLAMVSKNENTVHFDGITSSKLDNLEFDNSKAKNPMTLMSISGTCDWSVYYSMIVEKEKDNICCLSRLSNHFKDVDVEVFSHCDGFDEHYYNINGFEKSETTDSYENESGEIYGGYNQKFILSLEKEGVRK